ncbi:Oidioi.mRNA.OKI2018_I69.XSR.g16613.t1.cds [Oikopleura dioica]|uniref:Oidioi.mRNA.OKI2018_I69.XSR.g16613.t1.cds n=1 Tax=Oikopleura dioica TaxID=34765 RepID=A0ABN7SKW4_OIKDI|nr:Oidioi.mRNA.OKI2018_I69.XSR.g16613.t1.cds [Oikopleura dioica]
MRIPVAFFFPLKFCFATTQKFQEKLYSDLFLDYNAHIRPVAEDSGPVNVSIEIYLYKILDLDERNQILNSYLWMRQRWQDLRLSWDEEIYAGIKVYRLKIQSLV